MERLGVFLAAILRDAEKNCTEIVVSAESLSEAQNGTWDIRLVMPDGRLVLIDLDNHE